MKKFKIILFLCLITGGLIIGAGYIGNSIDTSPKNKIKPVSKPKSEKIRTWDFKPLKAKDLKNCIINGVYITDKNICRKIIPRNNPNYFVYYITTGRAVEGYLISETPFYSNRETFGKNVWFAAVRKEILPEKITDYFTKRNVHDGNICGVFKQLDSYMKADSYFFNFVSNHTELFYYHPKKIVNGKYIWGTYYIIARMRTKDLKRVVSAIYHCVYTNDEEICKIEKISDLKWFDKTFIGF